ncbi:MAG: alpha/beta hydrolase [Gemmatales bacterium]|nr:alpha/beta hydrolase [Gemmatales bacterium]MDW8388232.1 alpha/beta hydrolase [Gemmatales bacterium]
MRKAILAVLSSISVAALILVAVRAQTPAVKTETDVVYGKAGDTELKLDLAMPATGDGPFPAIVLVHGGGWKNGSYKDFKGTIQALAAEGFVAVSVQYRLTPPRGTAPSGLKARWPAQIEDCKCAVRWLRANASKYKVAKDRIGAVGFSAGGHLVLLLGLTTKEDGLEGNGDLTPEAAKESSRVQCVVDFFGPTDLTTGDWEKLVEPLLLDLLDGPLTEKRKEYQQASPITYVRKDKDNPPILIFHGTKDNIVRYNQSTKIVDALKNVGADVTLVTMEGDGHGWSGEKLTMTVKQTVDFFKKHLNKQ